jgi:ribosomal RNA assembly protein
MHTFFIEKVEKVKKAVPIVESKLKIRVSIKQNQISLKGKEFEEFLAEKIFKAIDFGFDKEDAILLKNENYVIEYLDIKNHTRRKNLEEVRGRVIGTDGKAKQAIETLTNSAIIINQNQVGIIVSSEYLDATVQAVVSIIQGAKHANVFAYLEKQNANKRKIKYEDLGLKEGVEELDTD